MATFINHMEVEEVESTSDELESTSDELVKFFISRNLSLDMIKDPDFQTLLKSLAQHGQNSSLFIQTSLWKFEHELKEYMRMVIESWKTTGCTLMSYNMKGAKQNKCIVGFYCPQGFIFLEVGPSKQDIENALTEFVPDSSVWNDIIQVVQHDACYHSECQYQALDLTGKFQNHLYGNDARCVRQHIHDFWHRICKESTWVQSLIRKSDKVFESMVTGGMSEMLFKTLKQKGFEEIAGWKHASSFARLRMIMKVKSELGVWLSQLCIKAGFELKYNTDVLTTITSRDFWKDVNELVRVLTPFFEIPNLMDTLIPSAGYLGLAMDKASSLLKTYSKSEPYKYELILECFKTWRDGVFSGEVQELSCYLNPSYICKQDMEEDFSLKYHSWCFYNFGLVECTNEGEDEESESDEESYPIRENKELLAELDAYCTKSSNPFTNVPMSELEANHPAILWTKYGGEFPLLQKCAYKFLSQPASCLCKQVEKHVSKIQGSDNYMLRLNGLMMEEFTKLGDQVYQPIHI